MWIQNGKTQNNKYYKTAKSQNSKCYETAKSQNGEIIKQQILKNSEITKRPKKIQKKSSNVFGKNHSMIKKLYSKSIIHSYSTQRYIISKFISSITLSTGQILKIRLAVFPKSMLATQRQWFGHDTSLLYKNRPFPQIQNIYLNL